MCGFVCLCALCVCVSVCGIRILHSFVLFVVICSVVCVVWVWYRCGCGCAVYVWFRILHTHSVSERVVRVRV